MEYVPPIDLGQMIANVHPNYVKLLQKLWKKVQDYQKQYGEDDGRVEFFEIFSMLTVWVLIQFDDFINTHDPLDGKIKKYMTLNAKAKPIMISQLDTINRASFLTKLMFDVEHFFKNILDYFNQNIPNGYGEILDGFLDELKITDPQTKNILKLPADIRNILHNNGYTRHPIISTTLRNRTYEANAGDQITFLHWDDIYIIIDEMADCLIDIIENNSIINSETNIPKKPHFI